MAYVKTEGSIALLVQQCDDAFKKLLKSFRNNAHGYEHELERCADEIGRFNGWERDVDGKSGHLDWRLRRSPQLHGEVTRLLSDLDDAFKSGQSQPLLPIYQYPKLILINGSRQQLILTIYKSAHYFLRAFRG